MLEEIKIFFGNSEELKSKKKKKINKFFTTLDYFYG